MVSVEKRDGPQDTYGKGHRVRMPFKQLAEALQSGDKNLYLTTQEVTSSYNSTQLPHMQQVRSCTCPHIISIVMNLR